MLQISSELSVCARVVGRHRSVAFVSALSRRKEEEEESCKCLPNCWLLHLLLCFPAAEIEHQRKRLMVEVGGEPWRSSSPVPLLKQVLAEWVVQGHVWVSLESLQTRLKCERLTASRESHFLPAYTVSLLVSFWKVHLVKVKLEILKVCPDEGDKIY